MHLLSTDFDGTLTTHHLDGRCSPAFADILLQHKASGGVWAVNTGRGVEHAIEGVTQFRAPVRPDFLLTNEREIFCSARDGRWTPHREWNDLCHLRHSELYERAKSLIRQIQAWAADEPDVTVIEEHGIVSGILTPTEEAMTGVAEFLDRESAAVPDFSYQRNTVYVRFCHRDYHKGTSLGELSRMLGIDRSSVLAAGDHFNDIPMLDGRYAAWTCCPSNAIPEVREVVLAAGGHVADKPAGDGVAEAWHVFQNFPCLPLSSANS